MGDQRRGYCAADARGEVTVLKQRSDSAYRMSPSWGYDSPGCDLTGRCDFQRFRVSRGCPLSFRAALRGAGD